MSRFADLLSEGFLLHQDQYAPIRDHVLPGKDTTVGEDEKDADNSGDLRVGAKLKLGKNKFDTMRVIAADKTKIKDLPWAFRELLQNTIDYSYQAIGFGAVNSVWRPFPDNDKLICIGRERKACVMIGADDDQIFIVQFGRPLLTDTLDSGCNTKPVGSAGGFGDGYKSSAQVLLYMHHKVTFEFYNSRPRNKDGEHYRLTWQFKKDNYATPVTRSGKAMAMHLCIDTFLEKGHQFNTNFKHPVMVTRIKPRRGHMEECKAGITQALGCFVLMYRRVTPAGSAVYLADNDRLVHKDKLVPLVPTFCGHAIQPDRPGRNDGQLALHGIMYPFCDTFLGSNALLFLPGKGMATDAIASDGNPAIVTFEPPLHEHYITIFTGIERKIQDAGLKGRFTDMAVRLLRADTATRDAFVAYLDRMRTGESLDDDFVVPSDGSGPEALAEGEPFKHHIAIIRTELKRKALTSLGDEDAAGADEAYLEARPYVAFSNRGEALYVQSFLSDSPCGVVPVDDDREDELNRELYPIKSIDSLKRELNELDTPFGCLLNGGSYGEIAKFILGTDTLLYVAREDALLEGYKSERMLRFKEQHLLLDKPPEDTQADMEAFSGEAARSSEEKRNMHVFITSFNDATNLMPEDASFEDKVARGLRIARGEEVVTEEQRTRASFNKLSEDVKARFIADHQPLPPVAPPPPLPLPPPSSGRDSDDGGGDTPLLPPARTPIRPRSPSPAGRRVRRRLTRGDPRPRPVPPPHARRVRIDPPAEEEGPPPNLLQQAWNEEAAIYTPNGDDPVRLASMADLNQRKLLMDEACLLVQEHVPDAKTERVRYTWSSGATWAGLHHSDGTIYVNLADELPFTMANYLGVLIHEIAHDFGRGHDKEWGMKMQRNFEALLAHMVPLASE